ncbi:hypothetical protein N9260_02335 [bacterium]|nr:hypothetical protein [bacterium]
MGGGNEFEGFIHHGSNDLVTDSRIDLDAVANVTEVDGNVSVWDGKGIGDSSSSR